MTTLTKTATPALHTYRLRPGCGRHVENHPTERVPDPNFPDDRTKDRPLEVTVTAGQTFTSATPDLAERWPEKFERPFQAPAGGAHAPKATGQPTYVPGHGWVLPIETPAGQYPSGPASGPGSPATPAPAGVTDPSLLPGDVPAQAPVHAPSHHPAHPAAPPAKGYSRAELDDLTAAELHELAKSEGVTVQHGAKKAEVVDALLKHKR